MKPHRSGTRGHRWRAAVLVIGLATRALPVSSSPMVSQRDAVVALVGEIQRADYEGDRAALRRLYGELAPFVDDRTLGVKVRYWRGFALWRRALNGFNEAAAPTELEEDLTRAVEELDAALEKQPDFVEAKIGAGSCLLNLVFLRREDPARVQELLARARPLLREAEMQEPENPRLLWVLGASRWYQPPERGGGQNEAIETYHKGLEAARRGDASTVDPLVPSWGEAELLMNLAWSHLNGTPPRIDEARRYARAALEIVPYWHYVKDILLPQIESAAPRDEQRRDAERRIQQDAETIE